MRKAILLENENNYNANLFFRFWAATTCWGQTRWSRLTSVGESTILPSLQYTVTMILITSDWNIFIISASHGPLVVLVTTDDGVKSSDGVLITEAADRNNTASQEAVINTRERGFRLNFSLTPCWWFVKFNVESINHNGLDFLYFYFPGFLYTYGYIESNKVCLKVRGAVALDRFSHQCSSRSLSLIYNTDSWVAKNINISFWSIGSSLEM